MEDKFLVVEGKLFDMIGVTDLKINEMNEKYLQVRIKGLDDKKGYAEVREGLRLYVKLRTGVVAYAEDDRKAAIRYQKDNIKEEKRVIALAAIGENHLRAEKKIVDDAEEAIRLEKVRQEEVRIQARRDRLAVIGVGFNGQMWNYGSLNLPEPMLKVAPDDQFEVLYGKFVDAVAVETARRAADLAAEENRKRELAQVAAEQEAERQRLEVAAQAQADEERKARMREKLEADERERKEAEIRAAQKKIDDEKAEWERIKKAESAAIEAAKQKAIDDERRAGEIEKARQEAALKAIKDMEEKAKREAEEKRVADEKARIAAEKKEARRPDRERLLAFAGNDFFIPSMKTPEGQAIINDFSTGFDTLINQLKERAGGL